MDNYFNSEITRAEKELTALKTAKAASSISLELFTKSVDISIPLHLSVYKTTATGAVAYAVNSDDNIIIWPTIDWYFDDVYDVNQEDEYRSLRIKNCYKDGKSQLLINARGSENDIDTMVGGGSVSLNARLTVVGTRDFTLEKTYEK